VIGLPGTATRAALLGAVGALAFLATAPAARAQVGDVRDAPDPAIIQHDGLYYVFATDEGIQILRSDDLVEWERIGRVFEADDGPEWAQDVIPGTMFPWAPDITFFNGLYHLYYSLSTFGSQRSVIALATNETLDPADPDYAWVDRGIVLESHTGQDPFNAIDAALFVEDDGSVWMSWGSHWGGIKMRRIDPETGLLSDADTTTYDLAARDGVDAVDGPTAAQAIEGPYIIRHDGAYWLFVSFDACCRGAESTYNVRVGRADHITGPYLDRDGVPMTEGGGTLVLASHGDIRGPGHNSILVEDDAHYLVHHYVNIVEGPASPDAPLAIPRSLQIRPLHWTWYGWPVAGPPLADYR
jgi:arabinan endo-1,5-alpha-L-arabinosidase